jgi:broad specificity phosphatase PhoE
MEDWTKTLKRTEVIFIRHAESFNNCCYDEVRKIHGNDISEDFLEGEAAKIRHPDCGLSERGHKQAANLKEYFSANGLSTIARTDDPLTAFDTWEIISSPMHRCLDTARSVSEGLKKSVFVHPHLYETGGCYETRDGVTVTAPSRSSTEIEATYENFSCGPGMENGWYARSEVENFEEFQARCRSIVEWIWEAHENQRNLIVVGHGNLLSAVVSGLQGGNSLILHHNTGFSHVQLYTAKGNQRVCAVKAINQSPHLNHQLKTGADAVDDHWIQEFIQ